MSIQYRPEIDGLRTVAVLAVIIYHAEFMFGAQHVLKGGFLGVDIFFVISGFLITSLIVGEYQTTGRFSFMNFYERRARRLLPVLLAVILVSIPVAQKYLYPSQLIDYAKSLLASLGFGSNIYWDMNLQEYGAESGLLKPFLHTWSLAVEEQYYIFFPVLLLLIYRWCRSKAVLILTLGFTLSLLLAEWMSPRYTSFSFYMLPTRFWELLAGGLLAKKLASSAEKPGSALSQAMPTLGFLLICYSIVFTEFNSDHPGLVTLIPVVGTVLIIWFATPGNGVTKLLSSRLFVWIGLISYSLYLWHYPIFAFARVKDGAPSEYDKLEWIALTFLLSIVSFFMVERPFRNRERVSGTLLVSTLLCASLIVIGFSLHVLYQGGTRERFEDLIALYGQNEFDNKFLADESMKYIHNPPKEVQFTSDGNKTRIFIVGNSHAKDLYNAFIQNYELFNQYQFEHVGMGIGANKKRFKELIVDSKAFQLADIVLVSNRYMAPNDKYVGDIKVLPEFIEKIRSLGKRIILASNTVEFRRIEEDQIFDWYIKRTLGFSEEELKKLFYKKRNLRVTAPVNRDVKAIAREYGVTYLEKSEYICDHEERTCDGITPDGFKSFYDYGHYTLKGAKHFGRRIHELGWLNIE